MAAAREIPSYAAVADSLGNRRISAGLHLARLGDIEVPTNARTYRQSSPSVDHGRPTIWPLRASRRRCMRI